MTMRTVGSRMNSRISDVITTISVPRRRTFTSGSRRMPRPSPVLMASDASRSDEKRYSRRPRKVKLSAHSHCRNWLASATSSIGSGGGLELKLLIACSTRARIACQSATQARTSLSVLARPSISFWRSASASRRADRKSTRLNSSHSQISYAVFCLKKKKKKKKQCTKKKKKKKKKNKENKT